MAERFTHFSVAHSLLTQRWLNSGHFFAMTAVSFEESDLSRVVRGLRKLRQGPLLTLNKRNAKSYCVGGDNKTVSR